MLSYWSSFVSAPILDFKMSAIFNDFWLMYLLLANWRSQNLFGSWISKWQPFSMLFGLYIHLYISLTSRAKKISQNNVNTNVYDAEHENIVTWQSRKQIKMEEGNSKQWDS